MIFGYTFQPIGKEQRRKMQKLSDCAIFHARVSCHIAEKRVGWNCFLSTFFPVNIVEIIFTERNLWENDGLLLKENKF